MAYKTGPYVADSDADDEYDRLEYNGSAQNPVDTSPVHSEGMRSPERTPTAFDRSRPDGGHLSPNTLITDWTAPQCSDYIRSLGLGQYAEAMIAEAINGEALVEMQQQDLKDMGITSVGHRLTVLKGVYEIKVKQNIPIDPDHYIPPSAEAAGNEMAATQEDIGRIIDSIRLRDQRIIAAESELRAMKEDLNRLIEENRKLREETLPIIRMAKDRSQPLPNPIEPALTTPPADLRVDKLGSGLSRKFSTKRLFLGSAPKSTSPTLLSSMTNDISLDPSAAAIAASNHLTATMSNSQGSPNTIQQLSPTSPAYSVAPSTSRQFTGTNENYTHYNPRDTTTVIPSSASIAPSIAESTVSTPLPTSTGTSNGTSSRRDPNKPRRERPTTNGSNDDDNIEIFKSFRVSIEDPCHKVLPVALKRYNINDDWRQYALYIVHGDQERCLGLEEKPLLLFKQLDREGRKPMFMLRKHASPAGEGWSGPQGAGGGTATPAQQQQSQQQQQAGGGGSALGLGGVGSSIGRGLPGGVL